MKLIDKIRQAYKNRPLSKKELTQNQLEIAKETLIDIRVRAHELSEFARYATKRIAEIQAEIDEK